MAEGNNQKKKVFVGLSGGVDSSVSAALLMEAGYDVTGVFIRVWNPDWLPCGWREERRDAMRVAAHLNIPFITLDLQEEYKKEVADYMIDEYRKGRTPNPDVMCNKEIKFGAFLRKAREQGADYIATGHYAQNTPPRLEDLAPLPGKGGETGSGTGVILKEGTDKNKDQSYFLWTLTQEHLDHILFPVGHLQKDEVRRLAKKFRLPTAEKKDSQGICFLGKIDMKEFLSHYIQSKLGDVLDESGKKIGIHDGTVFYTMGQRHGFSITEKSPHDDAYYVVSKDVEKNTVTVSHRNAENDPKKKNAGTVSSVVLNSVNWISGMPDMNKRFGARIRYRQAQQECEVRISPSLSGKGGEEVVAVKFREPQEGVSPGQSVVIYDDETCIGGGIIEALL